MGSNYAQGLIVLGMVLIVIGVFFGSVALLGEWLPAVTAAGALATLGIWTRRGATLLKRKRKLEKSKQKESVLANALIPELYGDYPPYIIEAAEQLGKAKDKSAVPALLHILENCVENQRPGWRDVAAALVDALAEIGDGRALDLLYRLENVRGIGFIPSVRNAIAVIEPQAILLRASSLNDSMLLRPAYGSGENDKTLLLRAAEREN